MRTDAIYDHQHVICHNASTLGVGQLECRVGDVFTYKEAYAAGGLYNLRIGRMLGRVASAPAVEDTPPIKGHILTLALHGPGTFGSIRWVDPSQVTEIRQDATAFGRWFFAEKLPYDAGAIMRLADYGTLCDTYIGKADEHVKEWAATNSENPCWDRAEDLLNRLDA